MDRVLRFLCGNMCIGSLYHVIGHGRIANRKFKNFEEYAQLYPEFHYVFIGDSGQGDGVCLSCLLVKYSIILAIIIIVHYYCYCIHDYLHTQLCLVLAYAR